MGAVLLLLRCLPVRSGTLPLTRCLIPTLIRRSQRMEMSTDAKKHNVVFVLGPPGSGKGTQCSRISQTFGFTHLSAGDLLRAERQRPGSEFGELIETHIRNGSIVPVEVTCKLIENAMEASGEARGFLVDGFPRNRDNLDGWKKEMDSKTDVAFVLYLQADVEICKQRCLGRSQGRSDDNEESMRKRIVTYNEHTFPIIQYYEAKGMVRQIDAAASPDKVFENVKKAFEAAGFGAEKVDNSTKAAPLPSNGNTPIRT